MDIGAWFTTIWANCKFDRGFYEKIDPAGTYHLVMYNMNIGKVQKFSQFWILGHLLASAIKVVSRGYKTYAFMLENQKFPLMSAEPKILSALLRFHSQAARLMME